jgi:hypothetical protein
MDSKTLPFADLVTVLQAILPYDLFPEYNRAFCNQFRDFYDSKLTVGAFIGFLDVTTTNLFERESMFERLVGQLAMRKVGSYDELSRWLGHS